MKNSSSRAIHSVLYLALFSLGTSTGTLLANDSTISNAMEIEEFIVTASRRAKPQFLYEGTITAIAGDTLTEQGTDSLQDLSFLVPAMTVSQPLKNRATINIRGMNTDIGNTQLTQDPTSLYLNNAPTFGPFGALYVPDLNLYDIERVEVLKGPQGTMFGSGSLAGSVRIITKQPVLDRLNGSMRVDYGSTKGGGDRPRVDAMINIPLIEESLAVRLVGSLRDDDGWVDNPATGASNSIKEQTARVSVLWRPNDNLTVDLKHLDIESEPAAGDDYSSQADGFVQDKIVNEGREGDFSLTSLDLTYQLGQWGQVESSTTLSTNTTGWISDFGPFGNLGRLVNNSVPFVTDTLTQEIRLVSDPERTVDWVVGAFYSDYETDSFFELNIVGLSDFFSAIVGPGIVTSDRFQSSGSISGFSEKAIFGDISWPLNDQWRMTIGARYSDTEAFYDQAVGTLFDFNSLSTIPTAAFENAIDDDALTGRLILAYTPGNDAYYYASISKGFRAGLSNPTLGPSFLDPTDVVIPAGSFADTTINYELGARHAFIEDRLVIESAVFFVDWQDMQVDALRLSDNRNYIANAGQAQVTGLEMSVAAQLSANWSLTLSGTIQDAEIQGISANESFLSGAVEGDRLPGAGDYNFNARLSYRTQLQGRWNLGWNLSTFTTDDSVNNFSNLSGNGLPNVNYGINEGYTNVNTRVSLSADSWELVMYAENLLNNDDVILNLGEQFVSDAISLRPRTLGARLSYQF